jgi:hypothetical protein
MKAYGIDKKKRYNYPDNHPHKGWINWWEIELGRINKGAERQRIKRELMKELNG